MDKKYKWICSTIVISLVIIGFFGSFWVMGISNILITTQIKMDENTREYLIEHDYCVFMESQPYDSNQSDIVFFGDCKYLNYSLWETIK